MFALFAERQLRFTAEQTGYFLGFVGLLVPHIMRLATGPDNRRLIPASLLAGALLLLCALNKQLHRTVCFRGGCIGRRWIRQAIQQQYPFFAQIQPFEDSIQRPARRGGMRSSPACWESSMGFSQ